MSFAYICSREPLIMKLPKNYIIAIDGFSSTGKSSLSKEIAKQLNFIHIDSGALYRGITLYALRKKLFSMGNWEDLIASQLDQINLSFVYNPLSEDNELCLNGENVEAEIRSMEISSHVSEVAKLPEVRAFLLKIQQEMGASQRVIMDGRDIGSVVFPQANLKIFLNASADVRAKRRYNEMREKGTDVSFDEVLANVNKRDQDDLTRPNSPLIKAEDAVEIDNGHLSREETVEKVKGLIK